MSIKAKLIDLFNRSNNNEKLVSFSIKNGGKIFNSDDYATYESFYEDYKKINKSGLQLDTKYAPNKINR